MINTVSIELGVKPAQSVFLKVNRMQEFVEQFLNRNPRSNNNGLSHEVREVQKAMAKYLFDAYQKMMLSIQTLLLALQIMESLQFKYLIQNQLEKHQIPWHKSSFSSVEQLKSSIESQLHTNTPRAISSLVIHIYSIGLLYLCHKITDDLRDKFASNVWVENLNLYAITKEDIQKAQSSIAICLSFDVCKPSAFTLISLVIQEMNIKKPEFAHFVCYLLQLYMNTSVNKFIGNKNRIKRMKLTLGATKLASHFLCPRLWDQRILVDFNLGSEGIEKYSRILFQLFMDKCNNLSIHEKYRMSRYRGVSLIKIVNLSKSYTLNKQHHKQSPQQSSGSQNDIKEHKNLKQGLGFKTHTLLRVSC